MTGILKDLQIAWRGLARSPGFAAVTVATQAPSRTGEATLGSRTHTFRSRQQQTLVSYGRLLGKHRLKHIQSLPERRLRYAPEAFDEATTVDRANLIENDVAVLLPEAAGDTERVGMSPRRHRRNDEGTQVGVNRSLKKSPSGSSV